MPAAAVTPDTVVETLQLAGAGPGAPVAVAWSPGGVGLAHGDTLVTCTGNTAEVVRRVLEALQPRLVWWSARDAGPLLSAGVRVTSSWDLSATHRLLHGGSERDPGVVWAVSRGLDPGRRPRTGQLDLLAGGAADAEDSGDPADPDEPVRPDGHLRPGWAESGPPSAAAASRWARAALAVRDQHEQALAALPDARSTPGTPALALLTAWSESAAELLAVELGLRGLPVDRATAIGLVEERIGPRPRDATTSSATW